MVSIVNKLHIFETCIYNFIFNMPAEKTAIIIGAGIGGITTSLYLARKGYKVTVYEKNTFPGGRCSQLVRDGHRFDLGATIYLMPEVYKKVFESLDIRPEDNFSSTPLPTIYTLFFDDGTRIAFSSDKVKLNTQLEKIEKGSSLKAEKAITEGYRNFTLAVDNLLGRNFYNLFQFVTLRNAGLLIKLKTHLRHTNYIKRFFRNEHLQKAFTFQNIYVGQNPYNAPALFSMLAAAELTEGSLFPVGGMFAVTRQLLSLARDAGVRFVYNEPVIKILTSGKRAEGVVLNNGSTVKAGIIVANADLPYVYRELLPDKNISKRLDRKTYGCSAIVLHWGLRKQYPQLGHHSVFLSASYKENLKKIFRNHSLSDQPSFYVHSPVRSDASAAPEGQDTLSVIIPAGHMSEKSPSDWNELKNTARAWVIQRLKQEGMNDIEENIKFEICHMPPDWLSTFNLTRGATFGLGHNILQMGYFRPHNRHRKYRNLYFAGGSTHPGNGIPLVLLSAKLTSERIFKEQDHE
ncbi:MAG TPA: phytoene desaturase family protein [Bacteroidales bacterium]|nr:phytoene desaturase family protein [Bacteroidales bacterium]